MYEDNKEGILDVKATLNNNKMVDIEIQLENEYNILKRSLYYWSGLYYEGLEKGQDYNENRKVVVISILDYNIFPKGKYHEKAYITIESTKERMLDELELHYIQLKKSDNTETKLEQWMQFIKYDNKRGLDEAMEKNKVIRKANERLEYLTGDAEVKRIAELRDRNMKAMNTHIEGERMKARAEGIKEEKMKIIQEMKKNRFKNEVIAKILKISEEELNKLLK